MPLAELLSLALLQIALILLVCRVVGAVIRRVQQPQVIAEMLAGFMLGPSLLGWVAPETSAWLFPAESRPVLYVASQLGLVLYMFTVGLEFRTDLVQRLGRTAIAVSIGGITGPLVLGGVLAILLYDRGLFADGATLTHGMLFTGAAMAITAFPVLARIISERGISGTAVGSLALAAGALNDAVAWILLAFVLASFSGDNAIALVALGGAALYALAVLFGAKPILRALTARAQSAGITSPLLVSSLVLLMLGAWFTDRVGVHSVFGAFLLGVAMPRGRLTEGLRAQIEPLVTALLVPIFFVYSGLNTRLGLLNSGELWMIAGLIFAVAVAAKALPCWMAARATGSTPRDAIGLAILMNTRGMVELILLNIGLQEGIISQTLFTMMVLMALSTTVMTGPLFSLAWQRPETRP